MTEVTISGEKFLIDGAPTYAGREFEGHSVEGLLYNTRMVQALFDDENTATASRWAYPDTGEWDPDRNVSEFVEALPTYASYGVRAVTVNLQGGMPVTGTEIEQPWENSAFDAKGDLKSAYFDRLGRILSAADEAGMVVIVGFFYFGQDQCLDDEAAVLNATTQASEWLLERGARNVLVEIDNECDVPLYEHAILRSKRVHELVSLVRSVSNGKLLVGTSFSGGSFRRDFTKGVPTDAVLRASDFVLVHTNNWSRANSKRIVETVRDNPVFRASPMPIVINEDSARTEKLRAVLEVGASWGYYDQGANDYRDGYQSPPVNWGLSTPEKRAFFEEVARVTGYPGSSE